MKETLNVIVVGHVDAGKSTLMGHLLFYLGAVSDKTLAAVQREAAKAGKSSFAYAWLLDEGAAERSRGVTMDIASHTVPTLFNNNDNGNDKNNNNAALEMANRAVTFLDAPGHIDFIPNLISGAVMADAAIIVLDATTGEFESGFNDGSTKEHSLILRSLGISQLIIAINKLEKLQWNKDRYAEIKEKMSEYLKISVGFKADAVQYIPVSGLSGENIKTRNDPLLMAWYSGHTLLEAIGSFLTPKRIRTEGSLRFVVRDVYKGMGAMCCSGRVEANQVKSGDSILLLPNNKQATVKYVENAAGERVDVLVAGETGSVAIAGLEANIVTSTTVFCAPSSPIHLSFKFTVQIITFEIAIPITIGFPISLFHAGHEYPAIISRLLSIIDRKTQEITKSNPRLVAKASMANVEIECKESIAAEVYKSCKELGRVLLRANGKTIAAGIIVTLDASTI